MSNAEDDIQFLKRLGVDGYAWAKEFINKFGGDEGLMIGWFCNAIENGIAHGRKAEGQRIWIECMKNVNPMNLEYEEKLKRIIFGEGEK